MNECLPIEYSWIHTIYTISIQTVTNYLSRSLKYHILLWMSFYFFFFFLTYHTFRKDRSDFRLSLYCMKQIFINTIVCLLMQFYRIIQKLLIRKQRDNVFEKVLCAISSKFVHTHVYIVSICAILLRNSRSKCYTQIWHKFLLFITVCIRVG